MRATPLPPFDILSVIQGISSIPLILPAARMIPYFCPITPIIIANPEIIVRISGRFVPVKIVILIMASSNRNTGAMWPTTITTIFIIGRCNGFVDSRKGKDLFQYRYISQILRFKDIHTSPIINSTPLVVTPPKAAIINASPHPDIKPEDKKKTGIIRTFHAATALEA